jgi:hypothetical protein
MTCAGQRDILSSPNVIQVRDVIGRLISTIEEENKILNEQRELSLDPVIHRKSQLLLELMRAQKNCSAEIMKSCLETEIRNFKRVMNANQQLLSVHLAAAKEVSNTILDVLRQNDSDGTYAGAPNSGRGLQ